MSENSKTPLTAIVKIYEADSPVEGHAIRCRIQASGLIETEKGSHVWGRASTGIQQAVGHLALAIRLNNEGADQTQMREAIREGGPGPIIVNADIGKLDASKITIKDDSPALFTFDLGSSSATIHADGIRLNKDSDWNRDMLVKYAVDVLPLILERAEREAERADYRARYGDEPDAASPVISLQDAVTAIREAIEDGDDATVDAAGDAIAELLRFIGQADDAEAHQAGKITGIRKHSWAGWAQSAEDLELAQAIAHERKRAQAEQAEREAEDGQSITVAQLAISLIEQDDLVGKAGWDSLYSAACEACETERTATFTSDHDHTKTADALKGEAHSGVAEGLAAAGSLRIGVDLASGPSLTGVAFQGGNADVLAAAAEIARRAGHSCVRWTYTHAEGLKAELTR